jgi:hypothetical protein
LGPTSAPRVSAWRWPAEVLRVYVWASAQPQPAGECVEHRHQRTCCIQSSVEAGQHRRVCVCVHVRWCVGCVPHPAGVSAGVCCVELQPPVGRSCTSVRRLLQHRAQGATAAERESALSAPFLCGRAPTSSPQLPSPSRHGSVYSSRCTPLQRSDGGRCAVGCQCVSWDCCARKLRRAVADTA